jgi:hypothetical protein
VTQVKVKNKFKYSFFNLRHFFSFLIVFGFSIFVIKCTSSKTSIYDFNYQLTEKIAKSIYGDLSVQIPKGWFLAENNEDKSTDIWLVKDSYSASIKFSLINLNEDAKRIFSEDALHKIVGINKSLLKMKLGIKFKGFTHEEEFEINNKRFIAFEYINENSFPVRVIVFNHQNKFYEVVAIAKTLEELNEVFMVQNSILKTIK